MRSLGLHLQLHQEICQRPPCRVARSRPGDHDHALHAQLFKLAIKTCHRRNVHAMGGMSAFIPIKSDPVANENAIAQVRADKEREAGDGHDGTWVAHPGLVPVALEIFDRLMPQPNQISKQLPDYNATRRRSAPGSRRRDHRNRLETECGHRPGIHRGLVARHRLCSALQSDGGRRHRRDQPRTALAMGAPQGEAR